MGSTLIFGVNLVQKESNMDENNMNGFGNTDEDEDFGGTTVLTSPGVNAFSNAQTAAQNVNPGQPEQQGQYGGFGQLQQAGQQNQYSGFGQFQQAGQPEQQNQYGGFGQFQQAGQPGQQNQYGGFGQFQQAGQPDQQNQYGGFNQFQQAGQPDQQNQYGGFNQFQQAGQPGQYGGFAQQPYGQPGQPFGVPQGSDMQPGKKLNKKLIAVIGGIVAIAIVVVIVLIILLSGGNGQKSASSVGDELAKAYEKGDVKAMIELMNDDYYELYNKTWGDNYVEDQFNDEVQDMKDAVGNVKSIKIEDRSEDKYEKDDIEEVNKTFDMLDVDIKVDECREIDMDVKIKGSESDADGEIEYTVIKSGSKWYLVDYDLYVY